MYIDIGNDICISQLQFTFDTAFKYFKIVLEPGGAVALAAAISEKVKIKNKNILVIASGGNVDKNIFENCLKTETI